MSTAPRVAVVTGGGRGIGRATALALARRGLAIALIGKSRENLDVTSLMVESAGSKAVGFVCDVADEAAVEATALAAIEQLGAPEVVVNAAGIVHRGPRVEQTPIASWDQVVAVNLRGPFLVARAFLPSMLAARRGRFIHVASISSTIGCPNNASYAASKWGLVGLSKSMAEELRGTDLASIAVLPGSVDTEMLRGSGFDPQMTPDDVASTIAYLALDAPLAINGSAVELFGP
jgi:3-oxoacyl-[acyl-carrier protein] reductase